MSGREHTHTHTPKQNPQTGTDAGRQEKGEDEWAIDSSQRETEIQRQI